jgi:hypothetical protein
MGGGNTMKIEGVGAARDSGQPMALTMQKERFNFAYITALAAHAGLNHSKLEVDNDSVDLSITGKGFSSGIRNPTIELQLKCTSQSLISGQVLKFPLSKKNYDDLRSDELAAPRYLVVLVVPQDYKNWIKHQPDHMEMHNLCYWVSIQNYPESPNLKEVTVDIPLSQRFTTESLLDLMEQASKRGSR